MDLPQKFNNFVQRCTQKNPQGRYQNFEEVLDDLRSMALQSGLKGRPAIGTPRKVMSMLMNFSEDKQVELVNLVDRFAEELKDLGVKIQVGDFHDI
jgi:serine/threonine protein kinase